MSEKKRVGMFRGRTQAVSDASPEQSPASLHAALARVARAGESKVYKFKRSFLLQQRQCGQLEVLWRASPRATTRSISLSCWTNCRTTRTHHHPVRLLPDHRCGVPFVRISTWVKSSWPAKHASGSAGDRCGQGRQHFAHRPPAAMQYASMEESLLDKERKRFFVPLPTIQTYRTRYDNRLPVSGCSHLD